MRWRPAALGGAAIVTAVGASSPVIATQNELLITTDPALIGRFKEGVPDYVSRCTEGRPVKVSVNAPGGHTVSVGQRMQAREPVGSGRRLRQAADGLHDAIELEGLEGGRLH